MLLSHSVAVKVLDKSKMTAEDEAALAVELEALQRLSGHESFTRLYASYDEDAHVYLVCEDIEGGELLSRLLENAAYSEHDARAVMRQLTEAVAHAHSLGIAHRDLRPGASGVAGSCVQAHAPHVDTTAMRV